MSEYVLDASVAVAWLVDDEISARADAAMVRLEGAGAQVPSIWHLEVRNALLAAERRGRIRPHQVEEGLSFLDELPINAAHDPDLDSVVSLARTHRLTCYDAVYLAVAVRQNAALATLDAALARAACREQLILVR